VKVKLVLEERIRFLTKNQHPAVKGVLVACPRQCARQGQFQTGAKTDEKFWI
jgi:hypothetical protein